MERVITSRVFEDIAMETQQTDAERSVEEIRHVVLELIENGRSPEEVVQLLPRHGIPTQTVTDAIKHIAEQRKDTCLGKAKRQMLIGVSCGLGGIAITVFRYNLDPDRRAIPALGLVLIALGLIQFCRGFKLMWDN